MKTAAQFLLLLAPLLASAQKVAINRVELSGENIIVHYNLEDSNPDNEYQIALYSSQDNFSTPLLKVKGDVGNEVKTGADKKITWNIKEELGPFKGRISLEVRGRQYIPVARFTNITNHTKMTRGRNHTITWRPGNNNLLNIEFLNGGQRISEQLNIPNNGSHVLYIPKNQSKGNGYFVRITDARNTKEVVHSKTFTVVPQLPLLAKVLPAAVLTGLVAILLSKGSGGSENGKPDDSIPLPGFPTN